MSRRARVVNPNPGLAGLVQQVPVVWTAEDRLRFIDAFIKVLDFTVAIVPSPSAASREDQP